MIIGFSAPIGHGKTTAANYLVSRYGARKFSFATPLKLMAQMIYGLNNQQVYGSQEDKARKDPRLGQSPRELLQFLGTDVCRTVLGPDVWVNAALHNKEPGHLWVCDDVRFSNEARAIQASGGLVIRLECLDVPAAESSHASETDDVPYNARIRWRVSEGPEEGQRKIDLLLRGILAHHHGWALLSHRDVDTQLTKLTPEAVDVLTVITGYTIPVAPKHDWSVVGESSSEPTPRDHPLLASNEARILDEIEAYSQDTMPWAAIKARVPFDPDPFLDSLVKHGLVEKTASGYRSKRTK